MGWKADWQRFLAEVREREEAKEAKERADRESGAAYRRIVKPLFPRRHSGR